jgi:hypothetical protein
MRTGQQTWVGNVANVGQVFVFTINTHKNTHKVTVSQEGQSWHYDPDSRSMQLLNGTGSRLCLSAEHGQGVASTAHDYHDYHVWGRALSDGSVAVVASTSGRWLPTSCAMARASPSPTSPTRRSSCSTTYGHTESWGASLAAGLRDGSARCQLGGDDFAPAWCGGHRCSGGEKMHACTACVFMSVCASNGMGYIAV